MSLPPDENVFCTIRIGGGLAGSSAFCAGAAAGVQASPLPITARSTIVQVRRLPYMLKPPSRGKGPGRGRPERPPLLPPLSKEDEKRRWLTRAAVKFSWDGRTPT